MGEEKSSQSVPRDYVARPTKEDVLSDVPGARMVAPHLLPDEVAHLSRLAVGEREGGMFKGEDGGDHDWTGAGATLPSRDQAKPTL